MKKLLFLILLFYCSCNLTNKNNAINAIKEFVAQKHSSNQWKLEGYTLDDFDVEIGEKKIFEIHLKKETTNSENQKKTENCVATVVIEKFTSLDDPQNREYWLVYPLPKNTTKETENKPTKITENDSSSGECKDTF